MGGYWSILRSHVLYMVHASSLYIINRDEVPLSSQMCAYSTLGTNEPPSTINHCRKLMKLYKLELQNSNYCGIRLSEDKQQSNHQMWSSDAIWKTKYSKILLLTCKPRCHILKQNVYRYGHRQTSLWLDKCAKRSIFTQTFWYLVLCNFHSKHLSKFRGPLSNTN